MTLFKSELITKIIEFSKKLHQCNLDIKYDESSFRDYLLIAQVYTNRQLCGKISMYYKPTKKTFSLKTNIANEEIQKIVLKEWDKLNGMDIFDGKSGIYEAFVDGSFISQKTRYASVIYLGNEIKAELCGTIEDTSCRQFGGELKSVIETIKWCRQNNVKQVRINYDYEGIEKFATGKWQAKNTLSKEYVNFIQQVDDVKILWRHVRSHSGNERNNRVDLLAKGDATEIIE